MHKRILAICVAIFLALAVIPTGFADNSDQVVITYGETAYMNQQYKSIVDNYFAGKTNVNINDIDSQDFRWFLRKAIQFKSNIFLCTS